MKIKSSCIILSVLAIIFGALIWHTDLMWIRGIVVIPLFPIAMLLSFFEIYGNTGKGILIASYTLMWVVPVLVAWLIISKTRLRNSKRTENIINSLALVGSLVFVVYILTYAAFRLTDRIDFQTRTMVDGGGMGSGKIYTVSHPVIEGHVIFDVLYPVASLEGNWLHMKK